MVLLTFNFKGIDELTGNPPILLDVSDDKIFKDVLRDVIDKLNPLLPEGKKLTLEGLSLESFDGEPVSYVNYAKAVVDVIIDFGTSFVVTPKRATGDGALRDVMVTEKEIPEPERGIEEVFDITNAVLSTEGNLSKRPKTEAEEQQVSQTHELDESLVRGGKVSEASIEKPSLPIITETPGPVGAPTQPAPLAGPAPSGSGVQAPPATLKFAKIADDEPQPAAIEAAPPATKERTPPAAIEPGPPSRAILPSAPPTPPPSVDSDKEERRKDWGKKRKAMTKASPPSPSPPSHAEKGEELEEFGEVGGDRMAEPAPAKKQYDKNISVDYFSVMNPENYYPVVVDIADIEQAWKPVEENIITGERKVQVKEKAVFETDTVTVRPVFPGCTVAPMELDADLTKPKELLTFYVTPLVRGGIKGELHFMSKGKLVHITETPAEVKDPRLARYIMLYGLLASMIPKIGELLKMDLETMLNNAVGGALLLGMSVSNFVALAGTAVAVIIGFIYFLTHRPKNARMQLHLTDFRMTLIPPTVL